MLVLKQPKLNELNYRKQLLKDKKTMEFNRDNGGTVDFNEKLWKQWYELWMFNKDYYYAYVYDQKINKYIGEVSYYFEEDYQEYVLNIIIQHKYRKQGYGKESLLLLCQQAKQNGIRFLCDDIDIMNPAIKLFKELGFKETWQRGQILMLKKRL